MNDEAVDQDHRVLHCDKCSSEIREKLVLLNGKPQMKVACNCHVIDKTTSMFKSIADEIPDWWYDGT